jgi:hypothetical protein
LQRAGWCVAVVVLGASAAGFFGRGPASHRRARAVDGSVEVEYERFLRWSAPTKVEIRLAPIRGGARSTETSIWVTREYVEDLDLKRVSPQPTRFEARAGRIVMVFLTPAPHEGLEVVLHFEVKTLGRVEGRVGVGPGLDPEGGVHIHHFIYP